MKMNMKVNYDINIGTRHKIKKAGLPEKLIMEVCCDWS